MNTGKNGIETVQPYLFFDGRCQEAIDFYKTVGAQVEMLMHFKDSPESSRPDCPMPPGDKVMHATIRIGNATVLASDGHCQGSPVFRAFLCR